MGAGLWLAPIFCCQTNRWLSTENNKIPLQKQGDFRYWRARQDLNLQPSDP
jgi:hypothetical protein